MRRRRPWLVIVLALAVLLALFFLVGESGGPSKRGDGSSDPATGGRTGGSSGTTDGTADGTADAETLRGTTEAPETTPSVSGRVVDQDGNALSGAKVRVVTLHRAKRGEIVMRSDENGRFADRSPTRGKIILIEILKRGHPTTRLHPEDLVIADDEPVDLDLAIPKRFHLAGYVKSLDGRVVKGARVVYAGLYEAEGLTDDVGRFRIEGIDSSILLREEAPRLRATCEGYVPTTMSLKLDGRDVNFEDITVELTPKKGD